MVGRLSATKSVSVALLSLLIGTTNPVLLYAAAALLGPLPFDWLALRYRNSVCQFVIDYASPYLLLVVATIATFESLA